MDSLPRFKYLVDRAFFRPHLRPLAVIAVGVIQIIATLASAASDPVPNPTDDDIEEIRLRIENLERDNRQLRTALSKRSDDPFVSVLPDAMIAEVPPAPEQSESVDARPSSNFEIESLVEGMMRRMNAELKSATDAQNQKLSSLERQFDAATKKKPSSMGGSFGNNNLSYTSADGNFKWHLGGTVQLDFIAPQSTASNIAGFGPPNTNLTQDSTNFRRLRTRADGSMYGWIDYVLETEYSSNIQNTNNGAQSLADNGLRSVGALNGGQQGGNTLNGIQAANVWTNFKQIPVVGNLRVGNQLDWFSLDHAQGARFADFMERAPLIDVLSGPNNNGFTPGVSVFNNTPDKLAGLQLGIYKNNAYDAANTFNIGNSFTYGGRAIWTPYYDEASEGRYLVHTAFGAEYRTFNTDLALAQNGENIRVRSRGDLRIVSSQLTPNFADTGNFFATDQALFDPEFALVWGPLTLQAEYGVGQFYGARTTQLAGGKVLNDVMITSGYAEALYFLTGENKIYDRQRGVFGQVIPKNNFKPTQGTYGAWQIGTRFDWTDLNSGLINGGRNENGTIGLNWFLTPNVRFQFNTVLSYINNVGNPVIGGPVGTAATGALQGSKFTGEGLILTVGTRMDINF